MVAKWLKSANEPQREQKNKAEVKMIKQVLKGKAGISKGNVG